jgi:hypothetical protein
VSLLLQICKQKLLLQLINGSKFVGKVTQPGTAPKPPADPSSPGAGSYFMEISVAASYLENCCMFKFILFAGILFSGLKAHSQSPSIHVLVALCDNKYQGIVKVPARIGNGQDPANNLYWGCGYGVKTFLKKQADWQFIQQIPHPQDHIYERIISGIKKPMFISLPMLMMALK